MFYHQVIQYPAIVGSERMDFIRRQPQLICSTISWQAHQRLQERALNEGRSLSGLIGYVLVAMARAATAAPSRTAASGVISPRGLCDYHCTATRFLPAFFGSFHSINAACLGTRRRRLSRPGSPGIGRPWSMNTHCTYQPLLGSR